MFENTTCNFKYLDGTNFRREELFWRTMRLNTNPGIKRIFTKKRKKNFDENWVKNFLEHPVERKIMSEKQDL